MTPSRPRPRWFRLAPLAAGLLGAACYLGSLRNGFTFDDPLIIVENRAVTGPGGPGALFLSHYWAAEERRGNLYRPLTMVTYWLNYRAAGASPMSYHLVNLLLHGAVTALVCLVIARLATPRPGWPPEALAAAGAVLFATHPIHSEAVVNIVGRAEQLAALFVLAAWWLRGRIWAAAPLYACGMLCKENAVVLPGLLLVEDLLRRRVRSSLREYAVLAATAGACLAVRSAALWPASGPVEGPFTGVPAGARILTAIGVLARYGFLLLWPARLSADYSYDQIPIVTAPDDPWFAAGLLLCLAGAAAAWLAARRLPELTAGILIFFVALLPASNLLFGAGVVMAERLLYLPSMGFCLAGAAIVAAIARGGAGAGRRPAMAGALAALLIALLAVAGAWRGALRTADWFDQLTLFEATVRTSPRSALAWLDLGSTYQSLGRLEEAEAAYRRVIEIAPERPGPHFNLATLLERQGRVAEAIAYYDEAARIDPEDVRALTNLGRALTGQGRGRDAIPILERAVALRPGAPTPRLNLAAAHLQAGDAARADRIVREVLADHPGDPSAIRLRDAIGRATPGPSRGGG